MTAWGIRCWIPARSLGRLDLPVGRIRFKNGWARLGWTEGRRNVVATLEDETGHPLLARDQVEACVASELMGRAVALALMKHNRYEPGEHPGDAEKIMVAA